jgi:hypothetical protein
MALRLRYVARGVYECCMSVETMSLVITALGVLIAAFGVPALFVQMRLQLRQRKLELGNFYIQRYWEIDDAMLFEPKGTDSHRRQRHRYLRLCEDEYDAASYRWLDPMHWKIWHEWLTSPKGASALEDDLAACDPGRERFPSVRACLAQVRAEGRSHSIERCAARAHSRRDVNA